MTMRYAIIGSGMMGQEHIRFLNHPEGATVTAVADPDSGMREQAAMLAGAEAFSDHRALLTSDILDNAYVVVDFENGVRAMLDLCPPCQDRKPWPTMTLRMD